VNPEHAQLLDALGNGCSYGGFNYWTRVGVGVVRKESDLGSPIKRNLPT
jgi:hypothetical protein